MKESFLEFFMARLFRRKERCVVDACYSSATRHQTFLLIYLGGTHICLDQSIDVASIVVFFLHNMEDL